MKLDIVVVEWVDAHTSDGWDSDKAAPGEGVVVYTVGFLVKQTKDAVTIASTSDGVGLNNSRITIPRGMVRSMRRTSVRSGGPKNR